MSDTPSQTARLQRCLDDLRRGDLTARDELLRHVAGRLERLTRKMLRSYPGVQRWAQTDDVLQNALLRLLRALGDVQPATVRDFFGLATVQIRRELLDLARHFQGPLGLAVNQASQEAVPEQPDPTHEPSALAEWREFHEQVATLPEEQREVVGLLFYQGLTQEEAAVLLGVAVRTLQRRWRAALLRLSEAVEGGWPGE